MGSAARPLGPHRQLALTPAHLPGEEGKLGPAWGNAPDPAPLLARAGRIARVSGTAPSRLIPTYDGVIASFPRGRSMPYWDAGAEVMRGGKRRGGLCVMLRLIGVNGRSVRP